jgi:hypothetical protein
VHTLEIEKKFNDIACNPLKSPDSKK